MDRFCWVADANGSGGRSREPLPRISVDREAEAASRVQERDMTPPSRRHEVWPYRHGLLSFESSNWPLLFLWSCSVRYSLCDVGLVADEKVA